MSFRNNFKVASLNVHNWEDEKYLDNIQRIVDLVKEHDPDILCLQESSKVKESRFVAQVPQFSYSISLNRCSILSKFKATPVFQKDKRKGSGRFQRYVTSKIEIPASQLPIYVTCLHLNHQREPWRLSEVETIRFVTENLFKICSPQIWAGDFNSLTREDYTTDQWNHITNIRKSNRWERPQTEVTSKMPKFGFVDCWSRFGRPPPLKTSRFETRVDYIYASESFFKSFDLNSVLHVDNPASDHNMVIADFYIN